MTRTPVEILSDTLFATRQGAALLKRRLPFAPPPVDYGANREIPPMGTVIDVDGIAMRIDPRMSPFNIRKLMVGRHTQHERALLGRHLQDDDRVLELGGGIGMVAIACAKRLGAGRVTSYEGNPRLKDLIEDNYALNGVLVDLHLAVLGRTTGTTTFHLHERFSHSRLGDGTGAVEAVEVPVVPYDEAVASSRPTVLVCDIQGGELELFEHADLSGLRMVLVELHPPLIGVRGMLAVRRRLRQAGLVQVDRAGTSYVYLRRGAH